MNTRLLVVPYACARMPIGILDNTLIRRLPVDSGMRVAFDCALGAFDMCAGQILHDPRLSFHGYQRLGNAVFQSNPEVRAAGPRPAPSPAPRKAYASTRSRNATRT
jgi:hypothetical protein